ncbi:Sodium:solute symporter family-domain-containing protein [Aspergillus pseudonomiae]|uniref:Sodium:solute symporter family-domain-containing protein n=1 Tax=Aspergillus pseudonomiae TaxID=1506151 RepID=A0A5N7DCC6_9EURO|nr:Sodium:solute symporter family-domain-containing protein [Aspergillus pseudonomiae]KAE8403805.1 Sodium:solute symporter family-domain-containing protein [Aspergillus pseudonomiae]
MSETANFVAPLSQGFGYGIIVGLGFAFALVMVFITWALKRYQYEVQTSEMFSTAGRSVKSGLVAAAVVSSWTWAATLLQSSAVAYQYGISGPFFYASGACVQIILFATLAIELKRRAPNAHTFLEVIRARYGTAVHVVFIVFCLMTNILVTAMLLTGGSAVLTSLTGVNTVAACFLLPIGVVLYTLFGGIKATFITDYMHTVVIIVVIFIYAFSAYASNDTLGSPGKVYDALVAAADRHPVEGNAQGSYLTMRSKEGGIFWVINLVVCFSTVFLDNGYYNKAIAAHPVHAFPGYVIGGLCWFAIPWLCASTMGISALALEGTQRMSSEDVTAGLVLPFAAVKLLGYSGAVCTTLMIFMAVTSAFSAQLIAVSSILTYDIYQAYINPSAKGKRLVWVSHMSCIFWAIAMASFATGLYYAGIGMGYLYLLMGVIISSAVFPGAMTLVWKAQNWVAAAVSPILGLAVSLIAWLVTAKKESGVLTVATTGANYPMLAGNVAALLSPIIFSPVLTYIFGPQNYDYESMRAIRKVDDTDVAAAAHVDIELIPGENNPAAINPAKEQEEERKLNRAALYSRTLTIGMVLCFLLLWPIPMYGSSYVFSKKFFTGWVVVGIIWLFCTTVGVVLFPLYEGRESIIRTARLMALDAVGKKPRFEGQEQTPSGSATPTEKVGTKSDV